MASYNKTILIGNLTRDPEVKFTPKGNAVCDIGLAVSETRMDANGEKQVETLFVDVGFFGKSAEAIGKYLKKGNPIFIEGKLQLQQWTDKQTNEKKSKLKVIGERFQFIGNKQDGDRQAKTNNQNQPSKSSSDDFDDLNDDDIPF